MHADQLFLIRRYLYPRSSREFNGLQNSYFYLAGLQHEPLLMFEISHMDRLFKTFQNVEAAYACLHQILKNKQALKGWEPLSA